MAIKRTLGAQIIRLVRTGRLKTGSRGVLYLPDGSSVHTLEDNPIAKGTYFLSPDDTGRFRNWVIESILETRTSGRNRHDVEIHVGNTLRDTDACILPGRETDASGVVGSRSALSLMRLALERDTATPKTWVLVISEAF